MNSCCIKVAINTERGTACSASTRAHRPDSASASRLLVSTSSPLSYPILRRFRHSKYFAVCNAFVNTSAVFVCVNFLSSCFAGSHSSLVSMCLRGPHPCLWIPLREPLSNRFSWELQECPAAAEELRGSFAKISSETPGRFDSLSTSIPPVGSVSMLLLSRTISRCQIMGFSTGNCRRGNLCL